MQSTDRDEFKTQLAMLCAAYDRVMGDREEAYWKGLAKMSLVEFARVVDWCVGENGPDRLPTTNQCWSLLKQLKKNTMQLPQIHKRSIKEADDNLLFFANRLLLALMAASDGLGEKLQPCLKFKRELVLEFVRYVHDREELATPHEFVRRFLVGINKIFPINRQLLDDWKKATKAFDGIDIAMNRPIPKSFADGLDATGQFDFGEYAT